MSDARTHQPLFRNRVPWVGAAGPTSAQQAKYAWVQDWTNRELQSTASRVPYVLLALQYSYVTSSCALGWHVENVPRYHGYWYRMLTGSVARWHIRAAASRSLLPIFLQILKLLELVHRETNQRRNQRRTSKKCSQQAQQWQFWQLAAHHGEKLFHPRSLVLAFRDSLRARERLFGRRQNALAQHSDQSLLLTEPPLPQHS